MTTQQRVAFVSGFRYPSTFLLVYAVCPTVDCKPGAVQEVERRRRLGVVDCRGWTEWQRGCNCPGVVFCPVWVFRPRSSSFSVGLRCQMIDRQDRPPRMKEPRHGARKTRS